MRRASALLFLALFCLPAQDLPPEVRTLARVRARVRQTVDQLPDCTCVETVDRFWKPAGKALKPVDRAIVQVLFSGGNELFAAPGDTQWDADPSAVLASGMMGNGLFAVDLKVVFLNNVSVITYHGEETRAGDREARYDFSISSMHSGNVVSHAGASGVVAMRGSFWADPETYDLRRMEFHAEEIPPELQYAGISTTIDYNRVRIGNRDVLLPQAAELRTTGVDGEEKWNLIEFTHCQGFNSESTLSFGGGDAAPAAVRAATLPRPGAQGTLPPNVGIVIALSAPLDDRAPAGSLIDGRVAGSVMQNGRVLIPEGALVKGRIRRLERHSDAGDYFIVALEFMRIETPSASLRFYSELQDVDRTDGAEMAHATTHVEEVGIQGEYNRISMQSTRTERVRIWTHEVPGVGTFYVRGAHFALPRGFKTVWKTQMYPQSAHP